MLSWQISLDPAIQVHYNYNIAGPYLANYTMTMGYWFISRGGP